MVGSTGKLRCDEGVEMAVERVGSQGGCRMEERGNSTGDAADGGVTGHGGWDQYDNGRRGQWNGMG